MRTITMLLTVGALLTAAPAAAAAAPPPPEPQPTIEYGAPDGTGNGGLVDFDDEVIDVSDLGKLTVVLA
ncbi:hypothetical protein [Actinomadura algeriensis]|uniref:Opacity protein-like surface antigen n=1 Tax=Actinomadura algeriensis TaxID=1679523 RepID=A0ABR9JJJ9_9ACTN|nr:hypothetical protein [Actinomadura algeriensis]MBE1530722.1 opacity protein-like surface antigen [Actinomadura algeriensis]